MSKQIIRLTCPSAVTLRNNSQQQVKTSTHSMIRLDWHTVGSHFIG